MVNVETRAERHRVPDSESCNTRPVEWNGCGKFKMCTFYPSAENIMSALHRIEDYLVFSRPQLVHCALLCTSPVAFAGKPEFRSKLR